MRGFLRGAFGAAATLLFFLNGFVQLYRLAAVQHIFSLEFFLFMVASVVAAAMTLLRVVPGVELTAGRRRLYWAAAALGLGMIGASGQPFLLAPTALALGAALLDGPNVGAELVLDVGILVAIVWLSWALFQLVAG